MVDDVSKLGLRFQVQGQLNVSPEITHVSSLPFNKT